MMTCAEQAHGKAWLLTARHPESGLEAAGLARPVNDASGHSTNQIELARLGSWGRIPGAGALVLREAIELAGLERQGFSLSPTAPLPASRTFWDHLGLSSNVNPAGLHPHWDAVATAAMTKDLLALERQSFREL
jgi:hypothetical protein